MNKPYNNDALSGHDAQTGHFYVQVATIIGLVLVSSIVIGAFWDTAYNLLSSFQAFPLEKSVRLGGIIEAELKRPGVLKVRQQHRTIQRETVTWTSYEYTVHVERATVFAEVAHKLAEIIPINGGQIFQTYFEPDAPKASIVMGVDAFITHTLVMTWDAPIVAATPVPSSEPNQYKAAIVIDDLGVSAEVVHRLLDFQDDLTFSVLPHLEKSAEIATLLHQHQKEVLLHLPMEPEGHVHPGKGAIMMAMTPETIRQTIERDLETVPYAAGVNNHMGSLLTSDSDQIQAVLHVLNQHDLFFLDSRTSERTVAYRTAQQVGVKAAQRKIFIDVKPGVDFAKNQLLALAEMAERGEPAIAIGHPKEATFQALRDMLPEFQRRNIKIVRLSELVK